MKSKLFLLSAAALVLTFASTGRTAAEKDIVDTAVDAKFTTLVAAVKEAGLVETLKGAGPFTVFAPTDEAFKKLGDAKLKAVLADKALLKKILLAHVVVGKAAMASDVVKMDGAKVNGFEIKAKTDGVTLGEAKVLKTDIKCSNGVIHVIDTVLVPAAE